jgi:hypothetical protein
VARNRRQAPGATASDAEALRFLGDDRAAGDVRALLVAIRC